MKALKKKRARADTQALKESSPKGNEERQLCLTLEQVTHEKATLLIPTNSDFSISLERDRRGTRVTFNFQEKRGQAQSELPGLEFDVVRKVYTHAVQRHLNLHIVMRNTFSSQAADVDGDKLTSAAA